MSIPRDIQREFPSIGRWAILTGWRGSIAHGTYLPDSDPHSIDDKDVQGICVPDPEFYLGLREFGSRGTQEVKRQEWDIVMFESRKALRLLRQGNPNIMALLWLPENLYITRTTAGNLILDNKDAFVGKHLYKPFVGYAASQAHKMENMAFKGYMGEKRKRLVEQFGYDTKNAAHLIRLLRMAVEFLTDGELQVLRHDASELLAIKHGEWTLERVKREAERLRQLADEAFVRSPLPLGPDKARIDALARDVVEVAWQEAGEEARGEAAKEKDPSP